MGQAFDVVGIVLHFSKVRRWRCSRGVQKGGNTGSARFPIMCTVRHRVPEFRICQVGGILERRSEVSSCVELLACQPGLRAWVPHENLFAIIMDCGGVF